MLFDPQVLLPSRDRHSVPVCCFGRCRDALNFASFSADIGPVQERWQWGVCWGVCFSAPLAIDFEPAHEAVAEGRSLGKPGKGTMRPVAGGRGKRNRRLFSDGWTGLLLSSMLCAIAVSGVTWPTV